MTAKEVAARFKDAHMENGHYMAACPCHSDKARSLDIVELGGRIRLRCHAGCPTDAILEAAGLDAAELITNPENLPAKRKSEEAGLALQQNVEQLGQYLLQMGQMVGTMQRRLEELERQQAAVTIRHPDVLRLYRLIRMRAEELCEKYDLRDAESAKIFRAAIKRDLLRRYGVRDLHDVPAAQLTGAENLVSSWVNIRLAMERREKA